MDSDQDINRETWDAICDRCGRCCYEKIDYAGRIYYTKIPCEHLDLETRLCRVYPERSRIRPGCVELTEDRLVKGFLPPDCPYVVGFDDYPAPVMPEDDEE